MKLEYLNFYFDFSKNNFSTFKFQNVPLKYKYPNIAQLAERPTVESRIRKVVIGRSLVRIRVFGGLFLPFFSQKNLTFKI